MDGWMDDSIGGIAFVAPFPIWLSMLWPLALETPTTLFTLLLLLLHTGGATSAVAPLTPLPHLPPPPSSLLPPPSSLLPPPYLINSQPLTLPSPSTHLLQQHSLLLLVSLLPHLSLLRGQNETCRRVAPASNHPPPHANAVYRYAYVTYAYTLKIS